MYEEGDRVLDASEIESMLNSDDNNAVPVHAYGMDIYLHHVYGMYIYW
jgi:hypothetical protein